MAIFLGILSVIGKILLVILLMILTLLLLILFVPLRYRMDGSVDEGNIHATAGVSWLMRFLQAEIIADKDGEGFRKRLVFRIAGISPQEMKNKRRQKEKEKRKQKRRKELDELKETDPEKYEELKTEAARRKAVREAKNHESETSACDGEAKEPDGKCSAADDQSLELSGEAAANSKTASANHAAKTDPAGSDESAESQAEDSAAAAKAAEAKVAEAKAAEAKAAEAKAAEAKAAEAKAAEAKSAEAKAAEAKTAEPKTAKKTASKKPLRVRVKRAAAKALVRLKRMAFKILSFLVGGICAAAGVPGEITAKIGERIGHFRAVMEKAGEWAEFLRGDDFKGTVRILLITLKKLIGHICPKKVKIDADFGFEDPALTGKVLAAGSLAIAKFGDGIHLRPDFENAHQNGTIQMEGRLYLFYVLWRLIRIALTRNVWRAWKWFKSRNKEAQ